VPDGKPHRERTGHHPVAVAAGFAWGFAVVISSPASDEAAAQAVRENPTGRARLAVLCDFPEEGWPSMDLAAEMLLAQPSPFDARRVCPPYRHRLTRLPVLGRRRVAANADRLLNRFFDYHRHLREAQRDFELFHVVDHSYAQLVHSLPAERTGVFCHDLDAFRCLLGLERRPRWFRAMTRRILAGMQKAAVVFYSTTPVRQQIERHGLVDPDRLVQAPYGVAAEFTAEPAGDEVLLAPLPGLVHRPYALHVGSCIPRKRIDVLLDVFAGVRARRPDLRLVKVGGPWTAEQAAQIERLAVGPAILAFRDLSRRQIAELYRNAAVVLLPSEAEGFGLPVIEALACGAAVLASDLPVLREVAGASAVYCPVGDVGAWIAAVEGLLERPDSAPPPGDRRKQAANFTWHAHASTVYAAYERLFAHRKP
jgi:glycosyltransferase involved in cell wall biosynthesis